MRRPRRSRSAAGKFVETLRHGQDIRTDIGTTKYQPLTWQEDIAPLRVVYQRCSRAPLTDSE